MHAPTLLPNIWCFARVLCLKSGSSLFDVDYSLLGTMESEDVVQTSSANDRHKREKRKKGRCGIRSLQHITPAKIIRMPS